ncbi:hypothetical protein G3578_09855 [Brevibacillus sp. SYP-B805]|uniref:hypothetical protein n=1 Tax=Brevibacillus sp. SYP-B805 TaxID=1578199 RepID=UPI0013EA85D8|nr:hypothetical protein [Brevibacillus sp. SYP-B805]NGQ95457.1 hypothetical protein [Brevibacillus sp. SYP-B805]
MAKIIEVLIAVIMFNLLAVFISFITGLDYSRSIVAVVVGYLASDFIDKITD